MKRIYALMVCLPLLWLLTACTGGSPTASSEKKAPEPPPEPVTAQQAFNRMYITARGWNGDVQPYRLGDLDLKEVKSEGGKAGAWECTFVSPSARRARRYTYSVAAVPSSGLQKGVTGGGEESWSPIGQNRPFPIQSFKTDSVEAYDVAMKKGEDYAKKHPDIPVKFLLEATKRFSNPAWRVFWGESVATSSYSVFVDANTGGFLKIER
jgi:hypothetical protein